MKISTKDGGSVELENGMSEQFMITVSQITHDEENTSATIQLTNSQGYDLAMTLLNHLEVSKR